MTVEWSEDRDGVKLMYKAHWTQAGRLMMIDHSVTVLLAGQINCLCVAE